MQNARLDEAQAGIKTAGRNINNLRYADDTTLRAERKEEWRSLLIKVKEKSEKAGLKLYIQKKNKDHSIWSHRFMANDGETMETVTDFILGDSKFTADGDYSHDIKICFFLGRNAMTNTDSILKSRDITLPTNSV